MSRSLRVAAVVVISLGLSLSSIVSAQNGSVRVTAPGKANLRAEPNTTSAVNTQVAKDTLRELLGVEGDWFHVRVQVGVIRGDAYISKTVAKLEAAPAAASGAAAAAAKPKPAIPVKDGMSVGVMAGTDVTWLQPNPSRLIQIGDKVDSIAKSGPSIPAGDALPSNATGSASITYVWIADGASATAVVSDKRPSFYVSFKEVPGFGADDLTPMLVRLTAATSGVRAVGAIRGRADQATRTDPDWDVIKDFKQDAIKTDVQPAERGVVRLVALQDLAPGEYAVVFRPASKRKLAGADVLRSSADAKLYGVIWDFTVK